MTTERAPLHEEPMVDDQPGTTPWPLARERLANPEPGRTSWLATVRPDGRPHLMPIIAFWVTSKAFGLPGMLGMEQFDRADLPKPTRWKFDGS